MLRIRMGDLKLHLRSESDNTGVLIINAQAALFLNRTAKVYFEAFFDEFEKLSADNRERQREREEQVDLSNPREVGEALTSGVTRRIRRRFRVQQAQAAADWRKLWGSVIAVAEGGACPFSDFEVRRIEPLSVDLSAPYRCDLILTYRCQNNCSHCYAGGPHVTREIPTDSWKETMDRLSDWGVPTLVFTGGEPLLHKDIEELVQHAEDCGCITGLITNGRLLTVPKVDALARAGLDFIQVTLESVSPEIHDKMVGVEGAWAETVEGIRNASSKIYTTTNTTITADNKGTVLETIRFIKSLGAQKFGLNALIRSGRGTSHEGLEPVELKALLEDVVGVAADEDFPFIWYTPTCYKELNPVALGLGVKTCSAASTVMAIEPDGNVMPCQSYYRSIGNALTQDFPTIWQHPLAQALRRRRLKGAVCHRDFPSLPQECISCEELHMCGGSCPLERKVGAGICR